jgi:hypothetical protein
MHYFPGDPGSDWHGVNDLHVCYPRLANGTLIVPGCLYRRSLAWGRRDVLMGNVADRLHFRRCGFFASNVRIAHLAMNVSGEYGVSSLYYWRANWTAGPPDAQAGGIYKAARTL